MSTVVGHTKKATALDALDDMLRAINSQSVKSAEVANTELGGYDGPTTHPVKNVDDKTQDATEGARSKENDKDVKDALGAPSITGETKAAGQDDVQLDGGLHVRATGEDPEAETSSAGAGRKDTGYTGPSKHPARIDNNEIDGHKWASDIRGLRGLIEKAGEAGNALLANISNELDADMRKQAQTLQTIAPVSASAGSSSTAKSAGQVAGENLAAAVTGTVSGHDKQAEHAQVVNDLADVILHGYARADALHEYVSGFRAGLSKAAEEMPPGVPGEEPPPPGPGGEPDGDEEASLMAALADGEGGGEMPPGGGGGMPPEGGMPPGGGGMHPEGGMPPEGGMDMGEEAVDPHTLEMLAAALAEAGISPEQLMQATQQKTAQYWGAVKQASHRRWAPKTSAEARQLQDMVKYVKELARAN